METADEDRGEGFHRARRCREAAAGAWGRANACREDALFALCRATADMAGEERGGGETLLPALHEDARRERAG